MVSAISNKVDGYPGPGNISRSVAHFRKWLRLRLGRAKYAADVLELLNFGANDYDAWVITADETRVEKRSGCLGAEGRDSEGIEERAGRGKPGIGPDGHITAARANICRARNERASVLLMEEVE